MRLIATRITVVILELIRAKRADILWSLGHGFGRGTFQCSSEGLHLLDMKKPMGWRATVVSFDFNTNKKLVIHNNFANRIWSQHRRWIIQISALSTFDGRVVVYHGFDG